MLAEFFRVVAAVLHLLAVLVVAQHGDEHFVELQIAAAGVGEGAHGLFVGVAEIVEEFVVVRIDGFGRSASAAGVRKPPTATEW